MRRAGWLLPLLWPMLALAATPQISAGRYHTLAVTSDGQVYWWGTDYRRPVEHQRSNASAPALVAGLSNIEQVSAGWEHSLALDRDGNVYEWGYGPINRLKYTLLQPLLGTCEAARLLTGGHGKDPCAEQERARDKRIWTDQPFKVSQLPPMRAVRALDGNSFAISRNGEVYCWGGPSFPRKMSGLDHIKDVQLGQFHGLALREDGAVLTWGDNSAGQLGHPGRYDNKLCSADNQQIVFTGAIGIASSTSASYALRDDGSIWGWGANNGQFGFRKDSAGAEAPVMAPYLITTLPGTVQIQAGYFHMLARTGDGRLYVWGSNYDEAFGLNSPLRDSATPIELPALPVAQLAVAETQTVTLSPDGYICSWGGNSYRQARPDSQRRTIPQPIAVLTAAGDGALNLSGHSATPARLCGDDQWQQRMQLIEAADQALRH